jgi:hypothetical protein
MKIDILDQFGASPPTSAFVLDWDEGVPTTARDLIRERVRIEYDVAHEPSEGGANHLVHLSPMAARCTFDEAIDRACRGFETNRMFLIVDGRQVETLDAAFVLTPTSSVTFIRLIPLKGG